jgi:2-hydroxychromene-2-carboxylate isomerase
MPTIDYYVWLMSDWAYLGGVRFAQMAARHGLRLDMLEEAIVRSTAGDVGRGPD